MITSARREPPAAQGSWGGEMRDAYRYYVLAYEDARQKRPIKHEHGGTTVLTSGAEAIGRAGVLAKEFPKGWVYVHVEYTGKRSERRRRFSGRMHRSSQE